MIIREKDLGIQIEVQVTHGTFVFNYDGPYRSDLKESHKAVASDDVLDRIDNEIRSTKRYVLKKGGLINKK